MILWGKIEREKRANIGTSNEWTLTLWLLHQKLKLPASVNRLEHILYTQHALTYYQSVCLRARAFFLFNRRYFERQIASDVPFIFFIYFTDSAFVFAHFSSAFPVSLPLFLLCQYYSALSHIVFVPTSTKCKLRLFIHSPFFRCALLFAYSLILVDICVCFFLSYSLVLLHSKPSKLFFSLFPFCLLSFVVFYAVYQCECTVGKWFGYLFIAIHVHLNFPLAPSFKHINFRHNFYRTSLYALKRSIGFSFSLNVTFANDVILQWIVLLFRTYSGISALFCHVGFALCIY